MLRLIAAIYIASIATSAVSSTFADEVLVNKSEKKLYLLKEKQILRAFNVAFGENPIGHKQQEGDERTPEGAYTLDYKKEDSAYFRAIHISYPNANDLAQAKAKKVNPGGAIMIHGQRNGFGWAAPITQRFNWTNGCIALTNEDMQIVWNSIVPGTPIVIKP
jgi:murein L,D-transpeptidase YafK